MDWDCMCVSYSVKSAHGGTWPSNSLSRCRQTLKVRLQNIYIYSICEPVSFFFFKLHQKVN